MSIGIFEQYSQLGRLALATVRKIEREKQNAHQNLHRLVRLCNMFDDCTTRAAKPFPEDEVDFEVLQANLSSVAAPREPPSHRLYCVNGSAPDEDEPSGGSDSESSDSDQSDEADEDPESAEEEEEGPPLYRLSESPGVTVSVCEYPYDDFGDHEPQQDCVFEIWDSLGLKDQDANVSHSTITVTDTSKPWIFDSCEVS